MDEDEIRKNMHDEYMEELLVQEEDRLAAIDRQKLEQEAFDEEALRLTLEEEARWKEWDIKREQEQEREKEEWDKKMGLHPSCYISDEDLKKKDVPHSNNNSDDESFDQEPYNRGLVSVNDTIETQESIFVGIRDAPTTDVDTLQIPEVVDPASNKGKAIADPQPKKQGKKRQAHDDPLRIYHKNRGRSERIFGEKMKKKGFGPNGEGSTPDSAFSVD